ncbi:MAG: hypothetical protein M3Q30_07030, partial [Actinomycetota bacterium]|nr:hypothetical protein [Actinomycetota bacterium]
MIVLFILVGIAGVAGGVAYLRFKMREERVRAVVALAQRIGFTFCNADVEHLVDMPFALFSKGDGRRIELVISGVHNGVPMRMFDYWYYDETSNGHGARSRNYHRFTCALATIPAACP